MDVGASSLSLDVAFEVLLVMILELMSVSG